MDKAQPDRYRILREADLRDHLAQIPVLVAQLGGAPAGWSICEVGDGNLNLVFIVKGATGGLAVKQALPYVRLVGESWPLPLSRSHYEYLALTRQAQLAPGAGAGRAASRRGVGAGRHAAPGAAYHHAQGADCWYALSALRGWHHDLHGADAVLHVRPRRSRRGEERGHRRVCRQSRTVQDHGRPDLHRPLSRGRPEPLDLAMARCDRRALPRRPRRPCRDLAA